MIQQWLGLGETLSFNGDLWVLLGLSTAVYGYGGKPFLAGMIDELAKLKPGMMTLVAVVFRLEGKLFFWETATLIDLGPSRKSRCARSLDDRAFRELRESCRASLGYKA